MHTRSERNAYRTESNFNFGSLALDCASATSCRTLVSSFLPLCDIRVLPYKNKEKKYFTGNLAKCSYLYRVTLNGANQRPMLDNYQREDDIDR